MINVKGLEIANTLDFGPHRLIREKLTPNYFSHPCNDFKFIHLKKQKYIPFPLPHINKIKSYLPS